MPRIRRSALLVLALLAGGAANDFGLEDAAGTSMFEPKGAFGDYITGRFAKQQGDLDIAADRLRAVPDLGGHVGLTEQALAAPARTPAGRAG